MGGSADDRPDAPALEESEGRRVARREVLEKKSMTLVLRDLFNVLETVIVGFLKASPAAGSAGASEAGTVDGAFNVASVMG